MEDNAYIALRFFRYLLAIIVFALSLNARLSDRDEMDKNWAQGKKVSNIILICSAGFIWGDSAFFAHSLGWIGDYAQPLWTRFVSTAIFAYGLYSCIAAFTYEAQRRHWQYAVAIMGFMGVCLFGILETF